MAEQKYAFEKFNKELMAKAMGRDAAISTKQAVEISNYLRHRKVSQAKNLLEMAIQKKHAIPFKRFTDGLGHKPGKMAAGRYPVKASKVFLKLLESVEANAQTKGLNTSELEIVHICAHQAHRPVHYGRNSGREFKRTHIELVVQETAEKKREKKEEKKETKEAEPVKEKPKEEAKEKPKTEIKSAEPAEMSEPKESQAEDQK
jgi:large subunit ribosomal protein L22